MPISVRGKTTFFSVPCYQKALIYFMRASFHGAQFQTTTSMSACVVEDQRKDRGDYDNEESKMRGTDE